jgi:hypothetical protein
MKRSYPWLALGLGLMLSLVLMRYADPGGADMHKLPLLTSLLMSEFGFLVTAVAAGICIRDLWKRNVEKLAVVLLAGNLLLAANFIRLGLQLWPDAVGG